MKYLVITPLFVFSIVGCGESSSGSDIPTQVVLLEDSYDEKEGDIFTTSMSTNVLYSNGQTANKSSTRVETYSEVNEIPASYNYSNQIAAPYLLKTTTIDGELSGLDYMTLSGSSIIDDDLEYYSNIDYSTESGSEEPENINEGDSFSFYQNNELFKTLDGVEDGYEITNTDFTVLSTELLTVPAGKFDSIKIEYSMSQTKSENNVIDTFTGSGYAWFDTSEGYLLQITLDGNITLNSLNLTATFDSTISLEDYVISGQQVSTKALSFNTKDVKIDKGVMYSSFKRGIRNF
jgi:hypothetical protein